ncbi:hypothetical protein R3P38DRAFT_2970843 [Favolaschia claudopus]|uniref:Protein-S-isoprenylcysteine O-methyltransferase n=1 Tax=Favolaschia claudopus TaxID=2862362 RepID=A0AAW0B1K8_9AGAR
MSLSKIPCILAATIGLHISSTSPNPPQLFSEQTVAPTRVEFLLASYPLRLSLRCVYWTVAIAEIVVVIVQVTSPPIWGERILEMLAFGGDPTKVDLLATPRLVIGSCLITCGAVVRLQCYHALGEHFTFETGIFKNHKLVTTGPYSVVRHPSYSGAWLAYAGLMLYFTTSGSWVMECAIKGSWAGTLFAGLYALLMFFVLIGLTMRISKEDEALKNEFGKEWEDWAAGRFAVLPFVF